MFRLFQLSEKSFYHKSIMPNQVGHPKNFGPRNNRQVASFKNATAWPSNDHKVVKFEHSSPKPPFNIKELVSPIGSFVKFLSQPTESGSFETKIEMKNAMEAEQLWRQCQLNLTWGVLSVEPDFYYTLRNTRNGQNQKNQHSKVIYQEYWPEDKLQKAIKNKEVIVGPLRINSKKNIHSFISDPDGKDILIPSREERNRALDGDVVAVELTDLTAEDSVKKLEEEMKKTSVSSSQAATESAPQRKTGRVVAIVEKVRSRTITGLIKVDNDKKAFSQLQPCNHNHPIVCIPRDMVQKERQKQDISKVIFACKITQWDNDKLWPIGELCRVLGEKGQIEPETQRILNDTDVDDSEFTQQVIDCLPLTGQQWSISPTERAKRRDFTSECIFSIDPPHARDLDDALHCNRTADGNFEIGVHIADVSHFVKPQTELDRVASQRATSVYLVQRVIPMLPRLLCEQLCSLNPDVERLAFSVVWTITKEGKILDEWFGRSIIRSCAKLSYDHAQAFIDGTVDKQDVQFPPISGKFNMKLLGEKIMDLYTVSQNLRRQRMENGALRLDQVRLNYTLDSESGTPNGCYTYEYKRSNELIEEFMLLANMAVAHQLYRKTRNTAFLRCHPSPKEEMMEEMVHNCRAIGLEIDASSSQTLSRSLANACGSDELAKFRKMALFMLAIKPQQLANYLCAGVDQDESHYHHYALNVPLYTHFTSPIRRYADVIVHRQLAYTLGDIDDVELMKASPDDLQEIAKNCNHRKSQAKTAGELSVQLFFRLFVQSFGPLYSKAMVMSIQDHCFDVLSMEYGSMRRIYMDALPLLTFKYSQKDSILGNQKQGNMSLKWPMKITSKTKPVGLEPPAYTSISDAFVEQSYDVFSVVDIVIKYDESHTDGYRLHLRTPDEVEVLKNQ